MAISVLYSVVGSEPGRTDSSERASATSQLQCRKCSGFARDRQNQWQVSSQQREALGDAEGEVARGTGQDAAKDEAPRMRCAG